MECWTLENEVLSLAPGIGRAQVMLWFSLLSRMPVALVQGLERWGAQPTFLEPFL